MAKAPAPDAPTGTQVRILTDTLYDGVSFATDQVVELDAQTLAEAVALGWADPAPEAVAYAATLPINQPPA